MKTALKIVLFFALLLQVGLCMAQNDKEKIEALRVSFISKKLELSTGESEKFWPVYNEYNDKIKAVRKNLRQNYKNKSENIGEKEADELYALDLQSKQAETDLYKQYSEKIKAIIGVTKVVKLRLAEEEFKRAMLDAAKGRSD